MDAEVLLENICADLVTSKKFEAFPRYLLESVRPGEWKRVKEVHSVIGLNASDIEPDLFVTWLDDPGTRAGYVVILFYDEEAGWTISAQYNKERLLATNVNGAHATSKVAAKLP